MKVMVDNFTEFWDLDETLIESESVSDNYEKQEDEIIVEHPAFGKLRVLPKYEAIEKLKLDKMSGSTIVLWHSGGVLWPSRVVKALKLSKFIDLIVSKPDLFFDDEPADYILHTKGEIDE